ncbi:MAG: 4Fe-4S dicluster domain-containing protein [Deltaproteobacteria bacterium]|nr:4Fe-4S dicluster domain-containing protein [Candidatus Anaeroferrophillacea bacterium]
MNLTSTRVLLGNEAFARGLVENCCAFTYAYPGTPSSEILPAYLAEARAAGITVYGHWAVNEKIAMEAALTAAATGMRSCAVMKQVGLNVAADPLMSGAYTGVAGGMVVISADDPGPYSSQTEQDSRFFAMLAKLPVFDPATPDEARTMVARAFTLSEECHLPVLIRPTATLCHARQDMVCAPVPAAARQPKFVREPARWAATPRHRYRLHRELNSTLERLAADDTFRFAPNDDQPVPLAVVASGVAWAMTADLVERHCIPENELLLCKVDLPFPIHRASIEQLLRQAEHILVLEETYPVIEYQFRRGDRVSGRLDGTVPTAGELTPELVGRLVTDRLKRSRPPAPAPAMNAAPRRPQLCPGCPHRASFYALKKTLKQGFYAGDIGCYTLGLNLQALDTCLCMGASITQASAFYQVHSRTGTLIPPIAAVIGDSTFYHSGIPALINARQEDSRFVLLLLDNLTTAMTGNQPTPASGCLADGSPAPAIFPEKIIRGCGLPEPEVVDPYDQEALHRALRAARTYALRPDGGIGVVIARHPCMMDPAARRQARRFTVSLSDACTGCGTCIREFECPALRPPAAEGGSISIDPLTCVGCGLCRAACPFDAIVCTPVAAVTREPRDRAAGEKTREITR